jgi:hypothetical protein
MVMTTIRTVFVLAATSFTPMVGIPAVCLADRITVVRV